MSSARCGLALEISFRLTDQTVSRRALSANSRVRSHDSPCEIYVGRSGTGSGSSLSISVVPRQYHFPSAVLASLNKKDKRVTACNLRRVRVLGWKRTFAWS